VKHDVLPNSYTRLWFKPTRTGKYRLLCTQYCGTQHSQMDGWVYVMEPNEFERWLANEGERVSTSQPTLAEAGKAVFARMACGSCHVGPGEADDKPAQRGGSLYGLYGSLVKLKDGRTVKADEDYLRESILRPNAKIAAGYWPIMPSYQDQLSEEQVLQLVAYIKSLGKGEADSPPRNPRTASAASAEGGSQ